MTRNTYWTLYAIFLMALLAMIGMVIYIAMPTSANPGSPPINPPNQPDSTDFFTKLEDSSSTSLITTDIDSANFGVQTEQLIEEISKLRISIKEKDEIIAQQLTTLQQKQRVIDQNSQNQNPSDDATAELNKLRTEINSLQNKYHQALSKSYTITIFSSPEMMEASRQLENILNEEYDFNAVQLHESTSLTQNRINCRNERADNDLRAALASILPLNLGNVSDFIKTSRCWPNRSENDITISLRSF